MNRRQFLSTSPLFFAALALSAKTAGALPVGFLGQAYVELYDSYFRQNGRYFRMMSRVSNGDIVSFDEMPYWPFVSIAPEPVAWLTRTVRLPSDMVG